MHSAHINKGHVSSRLGSKRHCRLCMCPLLGVRCPASKSAEWNDAPHHVPKQWCRQRTVYSVHQSFPNQQSMPEMEPRTKKNQACKQIRNFHGSSFRQKRNSMKWPQIKKLMFRFIQWMMFRILFMRFHSCYCICIATWGRNPGQGINRVCCFMPWSPHSADCFFPSSRSLERQEGLTSGWEPRLKIPTKFVFLWNALNFSSPCTWPFLSFLKGAMSSESQSIWKPWWATWVWA